MATGVAIGLKTLPAWVPAVLGVATLLLLRGGLRREGDGRLAIALATGAGFAGWLLCEASPVNAAEAIAEVEGVLAASPERHRIPHTATVAGTSGDYTTAVLDVTASSDARVRGGRVLLVVPGHAPTLTAGQTVRTTGRLQPVRPPANPGEVRSPHDWRLSVRDAEAVRTLAASRPSFRERVRGGVAATLRQRLSFPEAAVAEALTLGRRDRVPEELSDAFRRTGTGHLLAISGTHVGIVTVLVLIVVSRVTRSVVLRAAAVAGCLLLFGWLVETRTSVTRSVLFAALAALGVAGGRRVDPFALLSVAAVVVMAGDPEAIIDPGTQLSFAAVTAILVFLRAGLIDRLTPNRLMAEPAGLAIRIARRAVQYLLWATVIWMAVLPLTWFHFGTVAFWGPLMTVLLLPVVSVAMTALFLSVAGDVWLPLPSILWDISETSLSAMVRLVEFGGRSDAMTVSFGGPAAAAVAAFYVLAVLACVGPPPVPRWSKRALAGWLVVSAVLSVWPRERPAMRVTSLSVGHGLCTVVQTAGDRTILLDVGSMADSDRTALRVEDALRELGVQSVQTVFLSHADRDHYGSLQSLLKAMSVGEVVIHPSFRDDPPPPLTALLNDLDARGVPLRYTTAGDRYDYGSVRATVLHPDNDSRFESDNEESLVVRLEAAGRTVLSTGDIEHLGQEWLMTLPGEPVDLLLSPHHGAVDANTRRFARWCRPKVVVCSSGHDRADLLTKSYPGAAVFQTLTDGAVTFTVTADGSADVTGYRSRRRFRVPTGTPPEVSPAGVREPLLD